MKKEMVRLGTVAVVLVVALIAAASIYLRGESKKREAEVASRPPPAATTLVRPHSRTLGPADAKVTVVEFFDPECESCRAIYPAVKKLLAQYGGRVRLVLRYMPLHGNSVYASSALEAAGEQGKYWEMLEALFERQPEWGSHHAPKPELIPEIAAGVGLDMAAFNRTVNSTAHRTLIETDAADGRSLGVRGTPTFFVNGKMLERLDYGELQSMINSELTK
jgi:protein-disulfide isomerase